MQLPGDAVGWRRRSGDAKQWVNVRQIGAAECNLHVEAGGLKGILHAAFERQSGRTISHVEIDWIGPVRLAQHQRRAANKLH